MQHTPVLYLIDDLELTHSSLLKAKCGLFGIKEDHFGPYLSLDDRFIKNRTSTFFFEASGQSMEPLIYPKDILVVDRSISPFNGAVCIISIEDEMFCKRYFQNKSPGGEVQIVLKSDNPSYKDIYITAEMNHLFFGVVRSIAREV